MPRMNLPRATLILVTFTFFWALGLPGASAANVFRAGAYAIDINPKGPTHIAGNIIDQVNNIQLDDLYARCIVVDDGKERVAIVVVDSASLPREVIDKIKNAASAKTGLPTDRMLISATHTHSAPSAWDTKGMANPDYVQLLVDRVSQGIGQAVRNLRPARIGWTVIQDSEHTHTRRWIRRPDRIDLDPWGQRNVRANMHPGHQNPDVIGPSGPSDPDISIVSLQTLEGRPIALLAHYAQHYVGAPTQPNGSPLISADYFGRFAKQIAQLIAPAPASGPQGFGSSMFNVDQDDIFKAEKVSSETAPAFVGILAQGTSGDQMWPDYSRPALPYQPGLDEFANAIAQEVFKAYQGITYQTWAPVRMAEIELTLDTLKPDEQRLARSREVAAQMQGRLPRTWTESFATWALEIMGLPPKEELKLQAIQIGELGFTAIPNEVFAITGLKIKAQSPFPTTINMELANGANVYLPPPEQFVLGGYTTWPMAHKLGEDAEPQIVESVLGLLEKVSGRPRRKVVETNGSYAEAVLASKPLAYWRLNEFNGPTAYDASGQRRDARYEVEKGVVFYLPGPDSDAFSGAHVINRAPHLAGGRLMADVKIPANRYSAEFWFWNGLPQDARGTTGWLFSNATQDSLGIGGTDGSPGKLIFAADRTPPVSGKTVIAEKTWNHLVLVRDGSRVNIYLNGQHAPEISVVSDTRAQAQGPLFLGGRADPADTFEGKLDEVAVYDRVLTPLEISDHFRLAGSIR